MLNFALIGFGYWGKNLYRNILKHKECNLKYICDLSTDITLASSDINLINDIDIIIKDNTVQCVVVATPIKTHYKICKSLLLVGKHVLVEKPITMNSTECLDLIRISEDMKTILMVDHTYLYSEFIIELNKLSGELKNIEYIDSERVNFGIFQEDQSVIWDLAPHDLSILLFIRNERPVKINAHCISNVKNSPFAFLTLYYADETMATLKLSWTSPEKKRLITVASENEYIIFDDVNKNIKKIHKNKTTYETEIECVNIDDTNEPLFNMISAFIHSVKTNETPISNGRNALDILDIIEAAHESIQKNKTINIKYQNNRRIKFLDLHDHIHHEEINNEIHNVIESSSFINGPSVRKFEYNFSEFIGVKYTVGVGNGTDAIELALTSLDLPKESEIIVQGNTYVATCQSVLRCNLELILCDVNTDTFQINISDLEKKITSKTRVLILVHLYGIVCNMDAIYDICNKNGIILIEDCAQSHGASYKGKITGSFGKISCFSFYPGKNLGAYGDAGAVCTNDETIYNKLLYLRNNGSINKYEHDFIGRNSRLDSIHAAVLNIKLTYLCEDNEKRRILAKIYDKELLNVVKTPQIICESVPVYHLYVVVTEKRDELQKYLRENDIETIIHYPIPISELKAFKHLCFKTINCENLSKKIISLPMYPNMLSSDVYKICATIKNFFSQEL